MVDSPLGSFLRARREQVTPHEVGIEDDGRRRVPGLRREELAMLAGVSPGYYVRLEQGYNDNPSQQVLDALARVLALDHDTTRHLHALAQPTSSRTRSNSRAEHVRAELARMLDHQVDAPAFVLGCRLDVLAANALARALHPSFTPGHNIVRDVFLDQEAQAYYPELDRVQRNSVGSLRAAAGRLPDDPRITDLVGELSLKSAAFRTLWARHEVRSKISGVKHFDHPAVGALELDYESFSVSGTEHQQLIIYHADPTSRHAQSLELLRSWATEHTQTPTSAGVASTGSASTVS